MKRFYFNVCQTSFVSITRCLSLWTSAIHHCLVQHTTAHIYLCTWIPPPRLVDVRPEARLNSSWIEIILEVCEYTQNWVLEICPPINNRLFAKWKIAHPLILAVLLCAYGLPIVSEAGINPPLTFQKDLTQNVTQGNQENWLWRAIGSKITRSDQNGEPTAVTITVVPVMEKLLAVREAAQCHSSFQMES